MFDSDLESGEGSLVRRRTFLLTSASAIAGAILWSLRRPSPAHAAKGGPEEVTIALFRFGRATEDDPGTEGGQDGRGMAQAAFAGRFLDHPSVRYRVCLFGRVLEPPRKGSLPLCVL